MESRVSNKGGLQVSKKPLKRVKRKEMKNRNVLTIEEESILINEKIDEHTSKGMIDDLPVQILCLDKDYYKLYQELRYKSSNGHSLKVHALSSLKCTPGFFYAATEVYDEILKDWMSRNDPNLKSNSFVYALSSLIESVIALHELVGDFTFNESQVMIIIHGDTPRCKIGMAKRCEPQYGSFIACITDVATIIDNWFTMHSCPIPRKLIGLINFMKTLKHSDNPRKASNSLKWVLNYPSFYDGKKKKAAFEFVIKFFGNCETLDDNGIKQMPADPTKIINSFEFMGYQKISINTPWFDDFKANSSLFWASRYPRKKGDKRINASIEHKMVGFFKGFRNISEHLAEHVTSSSEYEECYNLLEKMRPGCWSALWHLCHELGQHVTFVEKGRVI